MLWWDVNQLKRYGAYQFLHNLSLPLKASTSLEETLFNPWPLPCPKRPSSPLWFWRGNFGGTETYSYIMTRRMTLCAPWLGLKNYKLSQQSLVAVASTNSNDQVEINWYKLNIDASIKFFEGIGSLGAIVRNTRGEVMAAAVYTRPFSGDVEFAKRKLLFRGIS